MAAPNSIVPAGKRSYYVASICDAINVYLAAGTAGMCLELEMLKEILGSTLCDDIKAEFVLMGGHQHRLNVEKARPAKYRLIKLIAAKKYWSKKWRDFDSLYDTISNDIDNEFGTTPSYARQLTRYDIAKRIGYSVNCLPINNVYLHRASLNSAIQLKINGVTSDGRYPIQSFVRALPGLNALQIEDILCVMSKSFKNGLVVSSKYSFYDKNVIRSGSVSLPPCHAFSVSDTIKVCANPIFKASGLPILKYSTNP